MEALKHSPSSSSNSSHSSSSLINSGSRTNGMQPVSHKSQHSTIEISKFSLWIFVHFMTNKPQVKAVGTVSLIIYQMCE